MREITILTIAGTAKNKIGFFLPNLSINNKYVIFPIKPPKQTNETTKDASSFVIGPSSNLVVGDCNSRKFAFAQAQFQPNENIDKFAANFAEKIKKKKYKYKNFLYFPLKLTIVLPATVAKNCRRISIPAFMTVNLKKKNTQLIGNKIRIQLILCFVILSLKRMPKMICAMRANYI